MPEPLDPHPHHMLLVSVPIWAVSAHPKGDPPRLSGGLSSWALRAEFTPPHGVASGKRQD